MTELYMFSLTFFALITGFSLIIFLVRTSPWSSGRGGLAAKGWGVWMAEQIHHRFGVEREAFLARLAKLVALTTKYGVAAWTLRYPEQHSLRFWVLVWVLLLVIEVMRKAAQFYIPMRWENVSLKLDSEHFWLIHLIVLGTAEMHLAPGKPWGLASLVAFYIMFAGESRNSILAAFEDVAACGWAVVALWYFAGHQFVSIADYGFALAGVITLRGLVRFFTGRAWIRRRFWWVAQFCLMTALIIKSLVILNVLAAFNS